LHSAVVVVPIVVNISAVASGPADVAARDAPVAICFAVDSAVGDVIAAVGVLALVPSCCYGLCCC
jgi:hypothetical protein